MQTQKQRQAATPKQATTADVSPFLSYAELAARWKKAPKTIANGISSGRIPLKPVRLYPGADPVLHQGEIEELEAQAIHAAE